MTVRDILVYPQHKVELRRKSLPVATMNKSVKRLIRDLKDTLKTHPEGIGLAAPQINIHQRVVIVRFRIGNEEMMQYSHPIALINPVILEAHDERRDYDGCLSFPGIYGKTVRPHYLRVSGLDEAGKSIDRVFQGFDAVTVHHEIDHLEGILFIDHIESIRDLYRIVEKGNSELVRIPVEFEVR